MQPYEFINKEWIVSATARRVYRLAAYLSIMLFLLWCYMLFEGVPRAYLPFFRLLVFAGVLGAGTVFVGMEYFVFRFDQSHPLKQVAWFCVMLFPLLGPAIYCLVVYSRSTIVKNCRTSPVLATGLRR
jgi:hypothetical protein